MATIKKVNQYECEFCGKKKYSKAAINKHEKHCTMSPHRTCRMCEELKGASVDYLEDVKALMPDPVRDENNFGKIVNFELVVSSLEKVIDRVENCPACVLAVLRQKGLSSYEVDYDYAGESKSMLQEISDSRAQDMAEHYSIAY